MTKNKKTHYTKVDSLTKQALQERRVARDYKKTRIDEWKKNETYLAGRKEINGETRENISYGLGHKFVDTTLSKINDSIDFQYERGELGDTNKVKLFNALKEKYKNIGRWDFKSRLGKRNAIIYGLAVYEAYGEQDDDGNFIFNTNLVDAYDFFIDPNVCVEDLETARFMGVWGVTYSKAQLLTLSEDKNYRKAAIERVLEGGGADTDSAEEETDKSNRSKALGIYKSEPLGDRYRFYRWITTDPETGDRYYLIFDNKNNCIRCQKWTDIQKSGLFPFYYFAQFPEPYQFFPRGGLEIIRQTLEAQEKTINNLMDNAEEILNPQKIVNIDFINNVNELKYKKKKRMIEVTGTKVNVNDIVQNLPAPNLSAGAEINSILEGIQQSVGGATADVVGVSEAEKVGVYQGNIQQANSRFLLMKDSYNEAHRRLALLFREAVKQHFTKGMMIKVMGTYGYSFKEIKPDDIRLSDGDFDIMIVDTASEQGMNLEANKQKVDLINAYLEKGTLNPKRAFEVTANVVGFEQDEINRLLDTESYLNDDARGHAEEAMQALLSNREPSIYYDADESYIRELKRLITSLSKVINKNPNLAQRISEHMDIMLDLISDNEEQAIADQGLSEEEVKQVQEEEQAMLGKQQEEQQAALDQEEQKARISNLQAESLPEAT